MRRMITEKDVEKLDSIKPSEIEKLGNMQDPKEATAGQVLTAVAGGKAEFQPSQSGANISNSTGGSGEYFYKSDFTGSTGIYKRADFPGYVIAVATVEHTIVYGFKSLPHYSKPDGSKVYIAPTDYFVMKGYGWSMVFGIKQSVYDQFVADTAGDNYVSFYTGKYGQMEYKQN